MAKFLSAFLYYLMFFIDKTLKVDGKSIGDELADNGQYIFALWHENTFILEWYRDKRIAIYVSNDFRGKVLGRVGRKLGYDVIELRKDRAKSVVDMGRKIKNGQSVIMAVDGPYGPNKEIKEGTQYLSDKFMVPTVAVSLEYKMAMTLFWRWDKYKIPLPFSKVKIVFSEPFTKDSDWSKLGEALGS
jgi:lysophospholipid acyltransferase (LPLAT)-like uncharacterized protein